MEKLMYAIWSREEELKGDLNARLLDPMRKQLLELGAERLKINVIDEHVTQAALYTPVVRPPPVAMISFWLNSAHVRRPFEQAMEAAAPRIAGYSCTAHEGRGIQ